MARRSFAHTTVSRLLAAALALGAVLTVAGMGTAQARTADVPYSYTQAATSKPYMGEHKNWAHPLDKAVDVKRVWGGRDAEATYVKVRVGDLLRPRQVAKHAPYATQRLDFNVSKPASDGVGTLGFEMATVVVSKDATTITKVRQERDPACVIDVAVDRKANTVTVRAPHRCGLEDDPTGEALSLTVWSSTRFITPAPKHTEVVSEAVMFDLP